MPAVSKSQQRLMGMAYALKKGEMDPKDASQEVKDLADGMTLKQLKDFASTEHKNLPAKKNEKHVVSIDEYWIGLSAGHKWYTQSGNYFGIMAGINRDDTDPLIKDFIRFISSGKKPKDNDQVKDIVKNQFDNLAEGDYGAAMAGMANPSNTPGMGNVSVPNANALGSGDRFDNGSHDDNEENDPNRRIGIMSYEQYKKWFAKWLKQQKEDQA